MSICRFHHGKDLAALKVLFPSQELSQLICLTILLARDKQVSSCFPEAMLHMLSWPCNDKNNYLKNMGSYPIYSFHFVSGIFLVVTRVFGFKLPLLSLLRYRSVSPS